MSCRRSPFRTAAAASTCLFAVVACGCGNQMMRQPAFTPLDTPRGAPPQESVPVRAASQPFDAKPIASPAYGDATAAPVLKTLSKFPSVEPDLPPPDLSDQARFTPAPAAVNALKNPLPSDPRIVRAGRILFLNRCIQCHNPGGYGYGTVGQYLVPHPPDLASNLVQHISDGAIFWHITMGQGKMPGFRHWTTPQERWSLVSYVRSLKGRKFDPNIDSANAWTEASGAPYPVYGVVGFEQGKSAYPFKVINPLGGEPTSRSRVQNKGFGQPPLDTR